MVELVLHYRKTARHALDVLWGAVEATPATAALPCTAASGVAAVAAAVGAALAGGRRPVVAWSFYTASFAEAAAELAAVRAATGAGAFHVAGGPHASAAPEESGSARMLAAMGRGHGVEEVLRAVALSVEAGFRTSVDVMVGLPGEADEDRAATRSLLAQVGARGARVHAHAFMPLPGSPWAAERPGALDPETRALLERLEAGGAAHGQWRRQREVSGGRVHRG